MSANTRDLFVHFINLTSGKRREVGTRSFSNISLLWFPLTIRNNRTADLRSISSAVFPLCAASLPQHTPRSKQVNHQTRITCSDVSKSNRFYESKHSTSITIRSRLYVRFRSDYEIKRFFSVYGNVEFETVCTIFSKERQTKTKKHIFFIVVNLFLFLIHGYFEKRVK